MHASKLVVAVGLLMAGCGSPRGRERRPAIGADAEPSCTLVVAEGPRGAAASATFVAMPLFPTDRPPVIVDSASGSACLALPPGEYVVTATAPAMTAGSRRHRVAKGERSTAVVELGGEGFVVEGTVRFATESGSDRGIDRERVARPFAERIATDGTLSLFAGAPVDRRFRLALPSGSYRFGAGAEGYQDHVEARTPPYDGLTLDIVLHRSAALTSEAAATAAAAARTWIADASVRMPSLAPGAPLDVEPLRRRLGDGVEVLGLGEATHGARELALLRWKLFAGLAEHAGFRVFLAEAGWTEARAVDAYVTRGKGDARAALAGLSYPMWRTEEAVLLVEWMRRFNAGRAEDDMVRFAGIDMQTSGLALDTLDRTLRRTLAAGSGTDALFDLVGRARKENARGDRKAAAEALLAATRALSPAAIAPEEPETAIQLARIAVQAATMDALDATWPEDWIAFGSAYRDQAMAENALWVLRQAFRGKRALLSAHNLHTSLRPWGSFGARSMGQHLRAELGDRYLSAGTLFGHGSFAARAELGSSATAPAEPSRVLASPPEPSTFEHLFATAGVGVGFLDLATASAAAVPFLDAVSQVRYHDAVVHHETLPLVPRRDHDVLFYVDEISATLPTFPAASPR